MSKFIYGKSYNKAVEIFNISCNRGMFLEPNNVLDFSNKTSGENGINNLWTGDSITSCIRIICRYPIAKSDPFIIRDVQGALNIN
ncbi:hypothetical protein HUJ04_003000 [Dendroctonus ponderosae]|nr:hypothetical protein HUJ04_003000 [Dendroctonus ponderosae]